jgi:hypothetical protein
MNARAGSRLSERERRDYLALSPADQEGYRNLRGTNISHRNALDLLEKWRREDEPIDGSDEHHAADVGGR